MHLIWLDLETTGLDEKDGDILEVAAIFTNEQLTVLARTESLVETPTGYSDPMERCDDIVLEMHTKSGLWAARDEAPSLPTIAELDYKIAGWFVERHGGGELVLAGSGVATFDLRWIKEHMPLLASRLAYYTVDTGVLRRFLRDICGVQLTPQGSPVHRAMADAEQALVFAREWRHKLQGLLTPAQIPG